MSNEFTIIIACNKCFNKAAVDPEKMAPWLGMVPDEMKPETFAYAECEECKGTGKVEVSDSIMWELPVTTKNRPYK